jgi:long-chain acyl-CoA synthetase
MHAASSSQAAEAQAPAPRDPRAYEMLDATRYACVGEMLRDALVQFKTHVAFTELDRRRVVHRLSYLDVKRAVDRLARRLEDAGIGAGDRVAIVMTNQARYPIAATAAFFRGAIVVPIDYKLTPKERESLLAHAKPRALVTEYPLFAPHAAGALEGVPLVLVSEAPEQARLGHAQRWGALDGSDVPGLTDAPPTFVPRAREDVATIVYSSGTGGAPKGCMLPHRAYLAQYSALTALFPLVAGDRYFSILPTNHAIDFMCGFLGPLCGGAMVVHQRTLRPEFLTATMKSERITHMAVVPLLLTAFERAIREKLDALPGWQRTAVDALMQVNERLTERRPNRLLSRTLLRPIHEAFGGELRVLFCGGAFVEQERAELFNRLGLPVAIGYGLTEASTVATVNDLRPFRGDSVGRAVEGVSLRIVDPDSSGVGEVQLHGPTLMLGYLDDPEQTRAAFTDDGWLRTGDLGYLDASHHLHLVGRSKNMIVTRGGKNVYPEDIEGAFASVACEELAVFAEGYLWQTRGELVGERLVVVARLKAGASDVDRRRFHEALHAANQRLADYKRVHALIVTDESFPRTASMKIKRGELAALLRAQYAQADVLHLGEPVEAVR